MYRRRYRHEIRRITFLSPPPSKQTLTCTNGYKLDSFLHSGPQFNEPFDRNFNFNTRSDSEAIHRPPSFEENTTVYIKDPATNQFAEAKMVQIKLPHG